MPDLKKPFNECFMTLSERNISSLARHVTTIAELQLLVWDMLVEKRFMVKEIEFPFLSCYHNLCFRCLLSFVAVVVSVVTSSLARLTMGKFQHWLCWCSTWHCMIVERHLRQFGKSSPQPVDWTGSPTVCRRGACSQIRSAVAQSDKDVVSLVVVFCLKIESC